MVTLRNLIDKIESHLSSMEVDNLEEDVKHTNSILEDIRSKIDDIETLNNKIKVIVNDLNKSDYMGEVVRDLTDNNEEIGRIVY